MWDRVKITYEFEIDSITAFQMLCQALHMEFVLDEDANYHCHDGGVYKMVDCHEEKFDDRGDLFIALRNVIVRIVPNLSFRSADYIYPDMVDDD